MNCNSIRGRLLTSTFIVGAAASAFAATSAFAQTAPAAPGTVEEIVVTGSRIARQDYVATSPIVTVGQKDLERTGAITVEKMLNQLPQFVPSVSDTSNNPSNNGQANIQLRGLGTARTLVLVDGRRVTPSNSSGVIDVNTIPAALIENIETITGGASAVYGSDAIAGVVNFKLKHNFNGLQIDSQWGQTDHTDGQTSSVSITAGSAFAEDRGHAVLSLGYANRDAIFNGARAFSSYGGASATIPQGTFPAQGKPSQAAIDAVFAKYGVAPGTVPAGWDKFGFNSDGTLFFNGVNYKGPTTPDFSTIVAGKGSVTTGNYNTAILNELVLPQTRYNAFGRVDYNVTDKIKTYGQFSFTNYTSDTELAPSPASGSPTGTATGLGATGFLVPVTNPFIPADLKALLAARTTGSPTDPFLLNKRLSELGGRHEHDEYNIYQMQIGASGETGLKDWTWDAFAAYGVMDLLVTQTGNASHQALRTLLEAADGGASLCAGGYNPFGLQPLSAACRAYVSRTTKNSTNYTQRQVELNFQGGLFNLPAGEVRAAVGADYRSDRFSFVPDAVLSTPDISNLGTPLQNKAPGVIGFNAQNPLTGKTDVYELYGELLIPVLKDLPFINSLNINLGGRFSDYNTVGAISTWKADVEWKPIPSILVRGGYQTAIRAPNIGELYAPLGQNFPNIGLAYNQTTGKANGLGSGDPCDVRNVYRTGANGASVRALCLAQGVPAGIVDTYTYSNQQIQGTTGGNPNLTEESADSYSIGVVWQPHFDHPLLSKLSASIDYYNIDIQNAVGTVSASTAVSKCYNADGANPTYSPTNFYCSLLQRDATTGNFVNSIQTNANLAEVKTAGVDFQVDWGFGLGAVGLNDNYGAVKLNVVGTYLTQFEVQLLPGDPFRDLKGTIGDQAITNVGNALPEWKFLTSLTYDVGPVDLNARWRYIGKMTDQTCTGKSTCTATSPAAVSYYDLTGSWRINQTFTVTGGVNNITDKQPPFFSSFVQANTDPSTYDVLGRRYFIGLKATF